MLQRKVAHSPRSSIGTRPEVDRDHLDAPQAEDQQPQHDCGHYQYIVGGRATTRPRRAAKPPSAGRGTGARLRHRPAASAPNDRASPATPSPPASSRRNRSTAHAAAPGRVPRDPRRVPALCPADSHSATGSQRKPRCSIASKRARKLSRSCQRHDSQDAVAAIAPSGNHSHAGSSPICSNRCTMLPPRQHVQRPVGPHHLVLRNHVGRKERHHAMAHHHEQRRQAGPHADRLGDARAVQPTERSIGDKADKPGHAGGKRHPGVQGMATVGTGCKGDLGEHQHTGNPARPAPRTMPAPADAGHSRPAWNIAQPAVSSAQVTR